MSPRRDEFQPTHVVNDKQSGFNGWPVQVDEHDGEKRIRTEDGQEIHGELKLASIVTAQEDEDDGGYPACGTCGDPIDYCQGHGVLG